MRERNWVQSAPSDVSPLTSCCGPLVAEFCCAISVMTRHWSNCEAKLTLQSQLYRDEASGELFDPDADSDDYCPSGCGSEG